PTGSNATSASGRRASTSSTSTCTSCSARTTTRTRRSAMAARNELRVIVDPERPTIVMTRTFDAPRQLVYDAWIKPEHLRRRGGPRDTTMVVCEIDARVGGAYRFVLRAPDGQEFAFRGEYRELVPGEKTVCTEIFEPFPDGGAVVTATFEE